MLHFIIGLAVCIWIAERVAHYWREWRERRRQISNLRRGLRLADIHRSGEEIDKYVDDLYGIRCRKPMRGDTIATLSVGLGFVVVMLTIAAFH